MGDEINKEEYDKLMAKLMEKRTVKNKQMEPIKVLREKSTTPETAYRVVTEGLKMEIEDILKNHEGYGLCCVQGCCVSWCCVQIS